MKNRKPTNLTVTYTFKIILQLSANIFICVSPTALCYDKFSYCKDFVNKPDNPCETNDFIKYKCEKSCGLCGGKKVTQSSVKTTTYLFL